MRIAIIGAGISGLTVAHLLHRAHEVSVFEAGEHVGGHTNTIDVDLGDERQAIDTGFIVFNEPNYPSFCRLMGKLGVESQETAMSFSVRDDVGGLEYNGTSVNALFAQRTNLVRPRFIRMVLDILRFGREAPRILETASDALTVQEYVDREKYSQEFTRHYLVPLGASLWSCPAESFRRFPIRFAVEFLSNHRMLKVEGRPVWRTIKGGSKQYVPKLTAGFADRIRVRTAVESVERGGQEVTVRLRGGEAKAFDHVVLACHADTALKVLATPTELELQVLGAFPYQANRAILHTDASVLPRKKLAWASWNYRVGAASEAQATVTYNMNILQRLTSKRTFCVTLNDEMGIDPAKVIRRIDYHHPIYTAGRSGAWARHADVTNANRTSFCGAYWGFGFHEDGVRSGLAVAKSFGVEL